MLNKTDDHAIHQIWLELEKFIDTPVPLDETGLSSSLQGETPPGQACTLRRNSSRLQAIKDDSRRDCRRFLSIGQ